MSHVCSATGEGKTSRGFAKIQFLTQHDPTPSGDMVMQITGRKLNISIYRRLRKARMKVTAASIWASWDLWRIFKLLKIHKSSCNLHPSHRKASAETIGSWPQKPSFNRFGKKRISGLDILVSRRAISICWVPGLRFGTWRIHESNFVSNFFHCNLGVGRSKYFMFSARPCISAGEISKIFFVQYLRKNSNKHLLPLCQESAVMIPQFSEHKLLRC